ncbi:CHASE3 domain-containing protein [Beijerinckia sp. L45]|uniref:sensor histidine kinase n=1 Tax=Beijerinckia sp. L45 TaxID=1641855 RepID=UPI00131B10C1|nr:CHASE3 domain-containing protein [Beijerinckia sp. L45]
MPSTRVATAELLNKRPRLTLTGQRLLPVIAGFLVLLGVAAATIWIGLSSRNYNLLVSHTLKVRSSAYLLLTLVQDAETGQRGYLLTNDRSYLTPYHDGADNAPAALDDLENLARGNAAEMATIGNLRTLVSAKLGELARTVTLNESGDVPGALAVVKNNSGNNYMTEIRRRVGEIQDDETQMIGAENAQTRVYGDMLGWFSLGGIILVILLGVLTILSTRRNVLELQGAQEAMRETNDNLEGIVQARIADLQAANEEIQRFAYIVSHDLRAPLVNVMGFTSELEAVRTDIMDFLKEVEARAPDLVTMDRRAAIETDLPEALGFIRSSTSKMDRLINAILKLSREGRRVLTPQTIELKDLVVAQRESLSHQLAEGEAELTVQDDLPTLVSDRLAIEQVFGNLIENATKYLFPGRPGRIEVRGKTIGSFVRYEIADNGRGIDKKDFERIFELFRRSGEQDKPGEGIGLAHVRNLTRRLGGNIAVTSELGKGSTFTITLPAVFSNSDRVS